MTALSSRSVLSSQDEREPVVTGTIYKLPYRLHLPLYISEALAKPKIRVAIAEDHAEMRVVLRLLLSMSPEVEVVCESNNGQEAIDCVERLQPDVLVMDIYMPVLDGLSATKRVISSGAATRVLLISLHTGNFMAAQAAAAGAYGLVSKDAVAGSLLQAIEAIHRGQTFFS